MVGLEKTMSSRQTILDEDWSFEGICPLEKEVVRKSKSIKLRVRVRDVHNNGEDKRKILKAKNMFH